MKANPEFISRDIAGETVLVPVGTAAKRCGGLIACNGVGSFIWHRLENECSMEELCNAVLAEFEVSPETAMADTKEFVGRLKELGAIIG